MVGNVDFAVCKYHGHFDPTYGISTETPTVPTNEGDGGGCMNKKELNRVPPMPVKRQSDVVAQPKWEEIIYDRADWDVLYRFFLFPTCRDRFTFISMIEKDLRKRFAVELANEYDTKFKEEFELLFTRARLRSIVGYRTQLLILFLGIILSPPVKMVLLPAPPSDQGESDETLVDRSAFAGFLREELLPWFNLAVTDVHVDLVSSVADLATTYAVLYAAHDIPAAAKANPRRTVPLTKAPPLLTPPPPKKHKSSEK